MIKADIDRIEALLAKATQGEWRHWHRPGSPGVFGNSHADFIYLGEEPENESGHVARCYTQDGMDEREANAAAIVALHNAAPALIAAARENERLREALVTAMIPIEAILLSGAEAAHCQSVRDALHDAVSTARASLSTAKQETSDAN